MLRCIASNHPVLKIKVFRSPDNLAGLRSLWQSLAAERSSTVFQDFDLNLAAAEIFAGREEPFVVCAEASYGAAIVPAVIRRSDGLLRLLGEELFDYRAFLHVGDPEVLLGALAFLAKQGSGLEVVALREADCDCVPDGLPLFPFTVAPAILHTKLSAAEFHRRHERPVRYLRRLRQLGFELRSYHGNHPRLLHAIYWNKAAQDPQSLFRDPLRIEFMLQAALLKPQCFEIFTLERGDKMAAALVTLRDSGVRRLYTVWFEPEMSKLSPGMSLICEIARQSLAAGLDCDLMTGEQPFKLRLANSSVALYKLKATARQLAALAGAAQPALRLAG